MKLIDGEALIEHFQKECEERNEPALWFFLGFLAGLVEKEPEIDKSNI